MIVKAPTLLLLCGLSLAGAAAADPIGAPRHRPDRWIFGPTDEARDLPRKAPQTAQNAAIVPLPHPRPHILETTGAIPVPPGPPTAPMPQPTPLAAAGPQDATVPQPATAPPSATEQVEPVKDNGGAAMPPVAISDAGGGRIRIEAHDASLDQVLAALQDSHLIRLSASDPLSGTVTGTYTGTLPQVLSRILDGRNYFLRVTASGTELHTVDASHGTNAALRSEAGSDVDAAPAPAPGFSLSPPSPTPPPQRVTPSPAAKQRARAH